MRSTPSRLRLGLLLAVVLAAGAVLVARRRAPVGRHTGVLPSVGGDTWPPVPVKDPGAS